jgi:hypothetical protein
MKMILEFDMPTLNVTISSIGLYFLGVVGSANGDLLQGTVFEGGGVNRTAPVPWEWLSILASIVWMLGQCILLGRNAWV